MIDAGTPPDDLLVVDDLRTYFRTEGATARSVDGVSFRVGRGETLAIVGESGSGKSVTSLSIMRLIPSPPGRIVGGTICFRGRDGAVRDFTKLSENDMFAIRGDEIGMIFQEPMTCLNPVHTAGAQIGEVLRLHRGLGRRAAEAEAVDGLAAVGIPDPARRAAEYPHQMSGGMRQRVMIAMALACEPDLIIADEPTTALDVSIQAQIIDLMLDIKARLGTAILLITHDLGVVAEMADRIAVLYAGHVVEIADCLTLFDAPRHPYTEGLLAAVPRLDVLVADTPGRVRLAELPGSVPSPSEWPRGCPFVPRCPLATDRCAAEMPPMTPLDAAHSVACWERAP